jgi:hypothetical protein
MRSLQILQNLADHELDEITRADESWFLSILDSPEMSAKSRDDVTSKRLLILDALSKGFKAGQREVSC